VCIIGDVGSGKSSLLSSIIGDLLYADHDFLYKHNRELFDEDLAKMVTEHSKVRLNKEQAPIKLSEKIALVQQVPWIQN